MSKKVWNGKIEKDEFVQLQESSAQVMGLRKEAKSLDDVKDVGDACKILGFSPEQCKIAKNEKLSDEDMFNQLVKAGVSRENAKKLMLWYGVEPDEKWLKVKKESSNDVQEARKWWNSLSTNEQNDLVKKYYSMWDYYGLSKAHEIVSSSSKRLIYIWKKTSGMTNESVKKESEFEISGGGLAKPIKVKAKDKTDALKQAQDRLRTIFGSVPKSHFNVKAVKSKSKLEAYSDDESIDKKNSLRKIPVKGTPEANEHDTAISVVLDPRKGFLDDNPTYAQSVRILQSKFGYSDLDISRLERGLAVGLKKEAEEYTDNEFPLEVAYVVRGGGNGRKKFKNQKELDAFIDKMDDRYGEGTVSYRYSKLEANMGIGAGNSVYVTAYIVVPFDPTSEFEDILGGVRYGDNKDYENFINEMLVIAHSNGIAIESGSSHDVEYFEEDQTLGGYITFALKSKNNLQNLEEWLAKDGITMVD